MFKLLNLSLFAILISANTFSQKNKFLKVESVFTINECDKMRANNPELWNVLVGFSNDSDAIVFFESNNQSLLSSPDLPVIKNRITNNVILPIDFVANLKKDDFNVVEYTLFPKMTEMVYKVTPGSYIKVKAQVIYFNTKD